ncbi:MAG: tetratricopeptide repeat protein, partial [Pseudanabaena sp.]
MLAANPKANTSLANQISPVDQRAADEYRQLGLSYRKQERFDDAIAALQQSVKLDPQNIDGRIILG